MTSARGEAQLEGSGLGAGGWWVVEDGVEVQGSIVSENGTKRQKTGHAVDTNLGEVIIKVNIESKHVEMQKMTFLFNKIRIDK